MKVTQITRTISGSNYSNVSATAFIDENEDVSEAFVKLDGILRKSLEAISDRIEHIEHDRRETREAIRILKEAVDIAEKRMEELPF